MVGSAHRSRNVLKRRGLRRAGLTAAGLIAEPKPGTGADCAVVDQRGVCRFRKIRFRHGFGSCTLIHAGGSFLAVKTDGEVVLFRDGGKGPEILARTRPLPGALRALPALASGRLYLRDDRTLVSLDVGPEPAARPSRRGSDGVIVGCPR